MLQSNQLIGFGVGGGGAANWWDVFEFPGIPLVLALDYENDQYMSDTGSGQTARTFANLHTFARASTALFRDNAGVMQTASSGAHRFDHDKDGANRRLLFEENRQNVALHSDDWTDAVWNTVTNMTPLKDQTGVDGISNSASSLLATSGSAVITQAITRTSETRMFSVFMKRLLGTGTIEITLDGSTWTDVTSSINSSDYIQVETPSQTLADPVVGVRITTDTDKVAVQYGNSQVGTFATSPIPTTGSSATRADENGIGVDFDFTGEFSWAAEHTFHSGGRDGHTAAFRLSTDTGHFLVNIWSLNTTSIRITYKEITTHTKTIDITGSHGVSEDVDNKVAARFADNDFKLYVAGSNIISDTSCTFNTANFDEFRLGARPGVTSQEFARARYKTFMLYAGNLSDANLVTATT